MKSFLDDWGLTLATFIPLVGVAIMLLVPKAEEQLHKIVALLTTLGGRRSSACCCSPTSTTTGPASSSSSINKPWIPFINSRYHMGLDGISLPLIALTHAHRAALHHLLVEPLPRAAATPRPS